MVVVVVVAGTATKQGRKGLKVVPSMTHTSEAAR